jgi:hypothetical protein
MHANEIKYILIRVYSRLFADKGFLRDSDETGSNTTGDDGFFGFGVGGSGPACPSAIGSRRCSVGA